MKKPDLPYRKGAHFTIQQHTPPTPPRAEERFIRDGEIRQVKEEGLVEHCLAYPPLPGRLERAERTIVVVEEIVVKDGHGAQIVTIDDHNIAKIFDRFYYPDPSQREERHILSDIECMPTRAADYDYCNETEKY